MSKLKVYHHELRHNEYAEFYLKYEADKVLAEKDKEIAELKEEQRRRRTTVPSGKHSPERTLLTT